MGTRLSRRPYNRTKGTCRALKSSRKVHFSQPAQAIDQRFLALAQGNLPQQLRRIVLILFSSFAAGLPSACTAKKRSNVFLEVSAELVTKGFQGFPLNTGPSFSLAAGRTGTYRNTFARP